jgi:hypothetical protein
MKTVMNIFVISLMEKLIKSRSESINGETGLFSTAGSKTECLIREQCRN